MASEQKEEEDLEALGLVAHSYDALFSIRKRIRKINDLEIPLRGGVSTQQIGVVIVTFIVALMLFGFVISPIIRLLHIDLHPLITFGFIFGLPILAAQRAGTPMPYQKSINGSLASAMRYYLDDPIHRRGVPIKTPRRSDEVQTLHFARTWVMADNFAPYVPGEADLSDPVTESRLRENPAEDLQGWYDARARQHLNEERESNAARKTDDAAAVHHLRGDAASVYIPDVEPESKER